MDLFLVRHAIAANRDPERWPDDSLRTLTEEGESRFRVAARGVKRIVPSVDVALASPYPRAWRTAEILAEEAGWPHPEKSSELEAERPAAGVLPLIRRRARQVSSLALVGHEPQLSELASLLLTGSEDGAAIEMKKGAMLSLWVENGPGSTMLQWLAPPKVLRSVGRR